MSVFLGDPSGKKFLRYDYRNEKELESEVKKHCTKVFGDNIIYFDVKPKIHAAFPRIPIKAIPDGFALDVTIPSLMLIEYELSTHDIYSHITNQIMRFLTIIKRNKAQIFDVLRSHVSTKSELNALHDAIWNSPSVLMIIDEVDQDIKEIANQFNVKLMEFQTFVIEGTKNLEQEHFHQYIPLTFQIVKPKGKYIDFFDAILQMTKSNLKEGLKNFRSWATRESNVLQLWYTHRACHFEVWIKRGKLIEVGLHLETSRRKALGILDHFRKKEGVIKTAIPNAKFDDDWGPRTHWCKIYEEIPYVDRKRLIKAEQSLVRQIADLLTRYIEVLEPDLETLH